MKGEEKKPIFLKGVGVLKEEFFPSLPDCTQRYFLSVLLSARKQKIVWLLAVVMVLMMGYHARLQPVCSCSSQNV